MFGLNKEFDLQVLSTTMMGAASEVFKKMCSERFTDTPTAESREILEVKAGRRDVNIQLHYKFHTKCYISAINFFKNPAEQEKNKTCGFMIIYIKESCLIDLFRALGFPVDAKDTNTMLDVCGEFCNLIAGEFKNQLAGIGYTDLFMSAPQSYVHSVPEGIAYPQGLKKYTELSFFLFQTNAVAIDVAMADILQA